MGANNYKMQTITHFDSDEAIKEFTDEFLVKHQASLKETLVTVKTWLLAVDVELALRQEAKKVKVVCPLCEGTGQGTPLYGNSAAKYKCQTCDGKGWLKTILWEEK